MRLDNQIITDHNTYDQSVAEIQGEFDRLAERHRLLTESYEKGEELYKNLINLATTKNSELNLQQQLQQISDQYKKERGEGNRLYRQIQKRTMAPTTPPPSPSGQQGHSTTPYITEPLIKQLGELFSREDKKTIPFFKEAMDDLSITDWLKEAERVARNNKWDSDQRIRFFPIA